MKRHEIIFGIIKVPLEFLIVVMSFFLSRNIRLISDLIPGVQLPIKTISDQSLLNFAIFGGLLYVLIFSIHGLYKIKVSNSKIRELLNIKMYSIYWFVFFVAIVYLSEGFVYNEEIPRLIIFFTLIFSTFFVIIERFILNNIQFYLMESGFLQKRKMLLIMNSEEKEVLEDIKNARIYDIVGYINSGKIDSSLEYLGDDYAIDKVIKEKNIDEILFINSDFNSYELEKIFEYSRVYGARYRYLTNSFEISKTNTELSLLDKIPLIEIKNSGLTPWGRVIKRILDIFGSLLAIITTSPIMLIIAILIKLEDPTGPVIYKNRRVGQKGKLFNMYKFRYMKWEYCIKDSYGLDNNEDEALKLEQELIKAKNVREGALYKIKDDPRKMKIGAFIEKYSIDELPNFFNVLIGNMSIMGPRPHQPREVDQYKDYQKRVLTIKPGITGMGQVHGRENNSFDNEAKLDIFYIENWSFLLDLKILFKTLSVILRRTKD